MNNAESSEKCAHTPCKCPAPSDDEYCSTHCQNAAGGTETNCSVVILSVFDLAGEL
jgi:hypothetical protein